MAVADVKIYAGPAEGWVSLAGPKGQPGQAASITVGNTTTGPEGSDADVVNSGTANAAVLDFTIPRGDKGDAGQDGDAATISVGTVDTATLPAGQQATVTIQNSGNSAAATFDFEFDIPQGPKGADGTGVTITGSINYVGPPVAPDSDGAVQGDMIIDDNGDGWVYDGANWTNVGPIRGPEGPDGQAATVAATATAVSVADTAPATANVTNLGTTHAANFKFDFEIPKGADGAKGADGTPGADGDNAEVYMQQTQPTAKDVGALWIQTV